MEGGGDKVTLVNSFWVFPGNAQLQGKNEPEKPVCSRACCNNNVLYYCSACQGYFVVDHNGHRVREPREPEEEPRPYRPYGKPREPVEEPRHRYR
jgi:hypothetical protein